MHYANKLLLGAALFFAGITAASATVVYNWQSTGAGEYVDAVDGVIQVTDTAYQSGSLSFDSDTATPSFDDFNFPDSPILDSGLTFDFTEPTGGSVDGVSVFLDPTATGFAASGFSIAASLAFNDDGTLSGNFDIFFESENFDSSGSGLSWLVSDVNSDFFLTACTGSFDEPCSGGSGFWQLDSSTVPTDSTDVPAPSVWSLFGVATVGMFGLLGVRSRRIRA